MIIETSDNRFYRVEEPADKNLAHCWIGVALIRKNDGSFVTRAPKAAERGELVRKAASRVVEA